MAKDQLATVEGRIRALLVLKRELRRMVGTCSPGRRVTECRIIDALASQ